MHVKHHNVIPDNMNWGTSGLFFNIYLFFIYYINYPSYSNKEIMF